MMEIVAELDTIKEKRITRIEELLQSVHDWNCSSYFNPDTFQRFVDGVTVEGREDFIIHFRCGLSLPKEAKKVKTA